MIDIEVQERILRTVGIDGGAALLLFAILSWLFYFLFLRGLSSERHRILRSQFASLRDAVIVGALLFVTLEGAKHSSTDFLWLSRLTPALGFLVILSWSVILIRTFRIAAFEFLFFGSMTAGVPRLLVNVFSLLVSLVIGAWILTVVFAVQLSSLIATSAVLSIVLGLAMQDTLGNLFAAISLQIDKPFELGDWIELKTGSERIPGKVLEITWRATVMQSLTDEIITVPNRLVAQGQVLNYAGRDWPFLRTHVLRIPYDQDLERAKAVIVSSLRASPEILQEPSPLALVIESAESWVTLKIVYGLKDYGRQFLVGNQVMSRVLEDLRREGIRLAESRLRIAMDPALGSGAAE